MPGQLIRNTQQPKGDFVFELIQESEEMTRRRKRLEEREEREEQERKNKDRPERGCIM